VDSKVAVTDLAASIVTTQSPVPEQPAPLQPAKTEAPAASVRSVTVLPDAKGATQAGPQSMPAGTEKTSPAPVPDLVTARSKSAATATAAGAEASKASRAARQRRAARAMVMGVLGRKCGYDSHTGPRPGTGHGSREEGPAPRIP